MVRLEGLIAGLKVHSGSRDAAMASLLRCRNWRERWRVEYTQRQNECAWVRRASEAV